jgi:hypothetical protein
VLGGKANGVYEDTINLVKKFYESKGVSLLTAYVCWGECKYRAGIIKSGLLIQDYLFGWILFLVGAVVWLILPTQDQMPFQETRNSVVRLDLKSNKFSDNLMANYDSEIENITPKFKKDTFLHKFFICLPIYGHVTN